VKVLGICGSPRNGNTEWMAAALRRPGPAGLCRDGAQGLRPALPGRAQGRPTDLITVGDPTGEHNEPGQLNGTKATPFDSV